MHIEGLPHPAVLYRVRDGNRLVSVTAYDGKTVCDCGDPDCDHGEPVKKYFEELRATNEAMKHVARRRS